MTEKILTVQRMQDYINEHFTERITLYDLSEVAMFSPFYCARIFRELTGLSPADYIRRLRLSRSALRLRDEKCKVIDVAYDIGYTSVDGYQRVFHNAFLNHSNKNICNICHGSVLLPQISELGVKSGSGSGDFAYWCRLQPNPSERLSSNEEKKRPSI